MLFAAPTAFAKSPSHKANSTEGNPTSTRTPSKQAVTPENQVDTTKSGQTSDRTPSNQGEAGAATGQSEMSGSKVSAQPEQAYEETYKIDMAQEKQLKSGGGSK